MLYKNKFNLTGTPQQQDIVKSALDQIKWPWDNLAFPNGTVEIGWLDLNTGNFLTKAETAADVVHKKANFRAHGKGQEYATIEAIVDGRRMIYGIMYPSNGNMFIENSLVNNVGAAQATVSAEVAHDVDYFYPQFTDEKRSKIMLLFHDGAAPQDHQDTWWEVIDYGQEYYNLIGESFMQAFTLAYSDLSFGNSSFSHLLRPDQVPALRKILGVERTDAVAPTQPHYHFVTYGTSKVYHRADHYEKKKGAHNVHDFGGLRPCKICKPK